MNLRLTSEAVAAFAAKPFIQTALANPLSEVSVRSFYFGIDCAASNAPEMLHSFKGKHEIDMMPFWFGGHPDYDELCRTFVYPIRAAGKKEFLSSNTDADEWGTIDGRMARILLCDQLSRNAFRGSEEAFQYDGVGLELAKEMASEAVSNGPLSDSIYGIYANILILPLMHSESLPDHELGHDLFEWGEERNPDLGWKMKKAFFIQHTDVIKEFGRYPHRNGKKGRTTTPEEKIWLASPDCPMWAKSQA
jgi:uncharacterized protein (DUF924 family)